jgi:hypothetical protein
MARARSTPTKKTQSSKAANTGSGEFVCPECGKTFSRAASLGAHRNRAHGVAGSSTKRASRARRRSRTAATPTTATTRPASRRRQRSRTGATGSADGTVNRDALLQTLFPNGVPPRENVIRNVNAWLDEAERLAGSR